MSRDNQEFAQCHEAVRDLDNRGAVAPFLVAAEALAHDFPEHALAWIELGIACSQVARYADAAAAFDTATRRCKPMYRDHPYVFKGEMYRTMGKYSLAEKFYRKAIDTNPKNAEAWAFLGAILGKLGRFAEAKAVWRKYIKFGADKAPEGHLNLGLIYRAEKRFKMALRHADKAVELDPDYPGASSLQEDLIEVLQCDAR